jgi:hypothetical protein
LIPRSCISDGYPGEGYPYWNLVLGLVSKLMLITNHMANFVIYVGVNQNFRLGWLGFKNQIMNLLQKGLAIDWIGTIFLTELENKACHEIILRIFEFGFRNVAYKAYLKNTEDSKHLCCPPWNFSHIFSL